MSIALKMLQVWLGRKDSNGGWSQVGYHQIHTVRRVLLVPGGKAGLETLEEDMKMGYVLGLETGWIFVMFPLHPHRHPSREPSKWVSFLGASILASLLSVLPMMMIVPWNHQSYHVTPLPKTEGSLRARRIEAKHQSLHDWPEDPCAYKTYDVYERNSELRIFLPMYWLPSKDIVTYSDVIRSLLTRIFKNEFPFGKIALNEWNFIFNLILKHIFWLHLRHWEDTVEDIMMKTPHSQWNMTT